MVAKLVDLELVVTALMRRDIESKKDPHTLRAAKMFGVSADQVTPEQRREAKDAGVLLQFAFHGEVRQAYQDGEVFYDELTGVRVATYRGTVAHSQDITGTQRARALFLAEFPNYTLGEVL